MMRSRILVTDGDQRASLACVRSLGKAGHSCFVLGPGRGGLAAASRFCSGWAAVPDPKVNPDELLSIVREHLAKWECDVLLPITEASLRTLLPVRNELGGILLPFPPPDVFARVSDKAEVLAAARKLGISTPSQWDCEVPGSFLDTIPPEVFPVAVKPARSVTAYGLKTGYSQVSYAGSQEALRGLLGRYPPDAFPLLIQQRIRGPGVGVFVLLWDGALRAVIGHRRIREKPPSGGVSVVRQSTPVPADLLRSSLALLADLGFRDGVAMVEFKVDVASDVPYLMEINGRFWGSLQLAVDAGVDFPVLLLECARGRPPESTVLGVPGGVTRWLLGDLDQILLRLFKRTASLHLPEDAPGRLRSVFEVLRDFRPGVRDEVLRLEDAQPFFRELRAWASDLVVRRVVKS